MLAAALHVFPCLPSRGPHMFCCTDLGCPVLLLCLLPLTKHQQLCPKLFMGTEAPVAAMQPSLVFSGLG